jgi:hypothetical protein
MNWVIKDSIICPDLKNVKRLMITHRHKNLGQYIISPRLCEETIEFLGNIRWPDQSHGGGRAIRFTITWLDQ